MEIESNKKIKVLKVDGGATANDYLMQYQSDIISSKVVLPHCLETTSLGAAYLAGLESGYWKDLEEVKHIHRIQKEFNPKMKKALIKEMDRKRKSAIKATRTFK